MRTIEGKLVVLGSQALATSKPGKSTKCTNEPYDSDNQNDNTRPQRSLVCPPSSVQKSVGKTSMITRYVGKTFSDQTRQTIGASFFTCKVNLEDERIHLQVWDTAGQERFRSMAPMYYRNANAALLVFDLTKYSTFVDIKSWVTELRRNIDEALVLALVGNKCDLEDQRTVELEEGRRFADNIGASYHETSALQDEGIDQVFLSTALALLRLCPKDSDDETPPNLRVYDPTQSGGSEPSSSNEGATSSNSTTSSDPVIRRRTCCT